jgi:long-chain acyl-CoA synthetase
MLLQNFLEQSAKSFPGKTALIHRNHRLTYREIDQKANRVASFLREQGVQRGDRVGILLDNSPEAVIALFGILKADAVFLMLSPTLKSQKLNYILNDCQVKTLITHTQKNSVVTEAISNAPHLDRLIWVGEKNRIVRNIPSVANQNMFHDVLGSAPCFMSSAGIPSESMLQTPGTARSFSGPMPGVLRPTPYKNIDLDLASIIYTSGSTGNPKGVMLTHLNMISAATSIAAYLQNVPEDIVIDVLPLSFDYGLYQVLIVFKFGGTVILEKSFAFPYEIIKIMVTERVTGFPGVPTIFSILMQMEDLKKFDLKSLRYITNTAAALSLKQIRWIRETFPHARMYSMYGLTECKRVSYLPPEELDRRPNSVGKGMPNEEVWIVDDQGKRMQRGMVGELVVRGSNVMRGYWGDQEGTKQVLKPGFLPDEKVLYTGDLFRMDEEGFLYFVGRKDDMIKTRGEKVSPKEVENAIQEMEGILEVAVIPIPDEILGNAIKALVALKSGFALTGKDLLLHCRKVLEDFAVPKYFEFRESLPKNPSGKIDTLILKQEAQQSYLAMEENYGIEPGAKGTRQNETGKLHA